MKQLRRFLQNYKLFAIIILTAAIALGLQLGGQGATADWLLGIVASLAVLFLLWGMLEDLRHGRYGINILAATAIITSVILGEYWAALVVALILTGGKALEAYAEHRAKSELRFLIERTPKNATVIRKGKEVTVKLAELKAGDTVIIRAGELVPADAVVTDGAANFDEALLTGESLPQPKQAGQVLLSGTANLDGPVTAKVTASPKDSQYQQAVKLIRNAAASRAPFVRLADRYSLPFTFAAIALGGAAWALSGEAIRFLEVIIVATPAPLLLAVPLALTGGITRASRYGIIVKTGSALEGLVDAETVAFGKTGTLTRGELSVSRIQSFSGFTKEEVLRLAASLEQGSGHAISQAILAEARTKNIKPAKAKQVTEQPGLGLTANLKGKQVLIGQIALLESHGIALPAAFKPDNKMSVYVTVNGQAAGVISLSDELRPEAKAALEQLQRLGIEHTALITGDGSPAAGAVAKQLSIDQVYDGMMPADKLHTLAKLESQPAVFVGDGITDAPVLTAAAVGIALGARGSTAVAETADVIILPDNLGRVANAFEIAHKVFGIARRSIIIGIGLSLVLMGVFATGKFTPLLGAVSQGVLVIIVIAYALRAHGIKPSDVH
jgi:heavy metal translocating P-type ATPase